MLHGTHFILCSALCIQRQTAIIVVCILVSHLKILSVTYILHYISSVLQDFTKHSQSPVYMNRSHICIGLTDTNDSSIPLNRFVHTEYVTRFNTSITKDVFSVRFIFEYLMLCITTLRTQWWFFSLLPSKNPNSE